MPIPTIISLNGHGLRLIETGNWDDANAAFRTCLQALLFWLDSTDEANGKVDASAATALPSLLAVETVHIDPHLGPKAGCWGEHEGVFSMHSKGLAFKTGTDNSACTLLPEDVIARAISVIMYNIALGFHLKSVSQGELGLASLKQSFKYYSMSSSVLVQNISRTSLVANSDLMVLLASSNNLGCTYEQSMQTSKALDCIVAMKSYLQEHWCRVGGGQENQGLVEQEEEY